MWEGILKNHWAQQYVSVCSAFLCHIGHLEIQIRSFWTKFEYDGDMEYWLGSLGLSPTSEFVPCSYELINTSPFFLISSLSLAHTPCSILQCLLFALCLTFFHSHKKTDEIKQHSINSYFLPFFLSLTSRRRIQWQDSLISSLQCASRPSIISFSARKLRFNCLNFTTR